MTIRHWTGQRLETMVGVERTRKVRRLERQVRNGVARRLELKDAPKPKPDRSRNGWVAAEPFVEHPPPTMSRHQLLEALHAKLQPRTYLEVGVNDGASLALSRTRSVGVDPAFRVVKELECDVQLVRATSDDFFARPTATAHFGGVPVDLAFIDGMHLSDFALRDFMNVEPLMARTGVVVLDDVLPRNALEASRERRTNAWTGDVYKAVEVLMRNRPDLVVMMVNTAPTGTAVVLSLDPRSAVLRGQYEAELDYLLAPDPQAPPASFLDRSVSVDPHDLLALGVWERLAALREDATADLSSLWEDLRGLDKG